MKQTIIPVSGLPRSGSTLFQQIIGQNPDFYPTPTDGFINWWMESKRGWKENQEFRAMGMEKVKPRVVSAMKGMFEGFWGEEISQEKTIFLKSRGYMAYIEYLIEIFDNPDFKVICCVRDIRAILASFEKLFKRRGIEYPEFSNEDFVESQTVEGRAGILLRKNSVLGLPIVRLQDALRRHPQNIVLVPYKAMINDPKTTFKNLHDILELPSYQYDFENIKQVTNELDVYHGYKGLHDIKEGSIVSSKELPWKGMFEESFIDEIGIRYSYLNNIANQ